jgi:excisionase family DNA binding protein
MAINTPRLAYTVAEAAQALALSVRSLRYLMQTGKLGYVRVGRRVLIRHEDLEHLLRQGYCRPADRLDGDEPIRPKKQERPGRDPEASMRCMRCAVNQTAPILDGDSYDNTSMPR